MAASAIASLPFINTFSAITKTSLLFNGDNAVGTHGCAERTADALTHIGHLSGRMTLLVDFVLGDHQQVLGAGINAQAATLAGIGIKCNLCHKDDLLMYKKCKTVR